MPTPNLPPSQLSPELSGVSCPGLRACHAVGTEFSDHPTAIAQRFDGARWQLEGFPTNGLQNPWLVDVSCPSRFFCMAAGFNFDGAIGTTVAAKWTP
jgi:hypothetical protein